MTASLDDDVVLRREHIRRILTDTGYCCRNLLGWNYDEYGGARKNVGTGGVRNSGSHQRIVDMVDRQTTRFKLLEAPRASYKSTIAQGRVIRHILSDPNCRIYYVSKTDKIALEKATAIRRALESEAVTELFGPQRGEPWETTRFTVRGRTNVALQTPTFSTFSFETMPTGGRADLIIVDDPIDQESCTTPEMVEKSKDQFGMLQPFIADGGTLIVIGTRYSADDLFNDLEQMPLFAEPLGESIVLGAGVHVVKDEKTGTLTIEEDETGLTFPHMTLDFLKEKFAGMVRGGKYVQFSCQYLNVVPSASGSTFHRWMFQPIAWGRDMAQLSGYVLTDTAVSMLDSGCYSVIAYLGMDAVDNLYLLDLRVGHWDPRTFVETFFEVLETWQPKVNHIGEVWEDIALATSFEFAIQDKSKNKKLRLNPIRIKRANADRKSMRILRMHAPMYDRKFHVVNTVPRVFDDLDGKRMLWDPDGFVDARQQGVKQPGGELVDEFVRFQASGVKNDIADALAMALEFEKDGSRMRRYCQYRPRRTPPPESLTQQRVDAYRAVHYPQSQGQGQSWWENTIREQRGRF